MAGLDDLFRGNVVVGVAAGLGAMLLAPVLLPTVVRVARPALKGAIRAGILAYDAGCETLAEVREMAEDATAEVRAEIAEGGSAERPGRSKPARKAKS